MTINCKMCGSLSTVKAGFIRDKQRHKCKDCRRFFTQGDSRVRHSNETKQLVVRMYVNNCGFRRISEILELPLATVFSWVKQAGKIVDAMVKARSDNVQHIEILELDELYTYVKKNRARIEKQANVQVNIPEFGLLLIGTEAKWLHLR